MTENWIDEQRILSCRDDRRPYVYVSTMKFDTQSKKELDKGHRPYCSLTVLEAC